MHLRTLSITATATLAKAVSALVLTSSLWASPWMPLSALVWTTLPARVQAASAVLLDEVSSLHRAGSTAAALARADAYLESNPRDAQMRFLRSVLLSDAGRSSEAETLLRQLAQDYPELAEPHNNLAAIHASRGEYGLARSELQESLRLDPAYATAYENLGDVYLKLAEQAYAHASKRDSANLRLSDKLAALKQLAER